MTNLLPNKIVIESIQDYLVEVDKIQRLGHQIVLYRGQTDSDKLLPSIARANPRADTTQLEIEMINDLKRRSRLLVTKTFDSEWEWLVYAQHFGLKTRLLDWTSNPLAALWFACSNAYAMDRPSFVYVFKADNSMLVDITKNESPFRNTLTRILRPSLNNERIIAQSGWFTAHKFSKQAGRFIPLDGNTQIRKHLVQFEIEADAKKEILARLSIFGINNRTMFPDISGLCAHLNWKYLKH